MQRLTCPSVTKPYLLNADLLTALQVSFPFLVNWSPENVGSIYFSLADREHLCGLTKIWSIHGLQVDGVIEVWTSDGASDLVQLDTSMLKNTHVELSLLVPSGTQFVLLKHFYKHGESSNTTWKLLGKKGVAYPRSEPITAIEIATLLSLECGFN